MRALLFAKPLAIVSAALALFVVPGSSGAALGTAEACAEAGTCCPEAGSSCYPTEDPGSWQKDHYYKASGSCKEP